MWRKFTLMLVVSVLLIGCNTQTTNNTENRIKEVNEIDESTSVSLPKLADLVKYFDEEIDVVNIIFEEESLAVYGLNVTKTYDEINQILIKYDDFISREYNTGLSGSMGMDTHGNISYQNWIIENKDFEMTISYINIKNEFIKYNDEDFYKGIGKENIVIAIADK